LTTLAEATPALTNRYESKETGLGSSLQYAKKLSTAQDQKKIHFSSALL